MKTTKPLSTISYNTKPFLVSVLERLTKNEMISFWVIITHKPEEDENKEHTHVYLEPAKAIDTTWLRKQFNEDDKEHPSSPLGVMPIAKSKFADWYWYGLHDKAYLASKNQSRKYHYSHDDMLTSDVECLAEMVRQNPNPKGELLKVMELVMQGFTSLQIAVQMNVPTRNLRYFMDGVEMLKQHLRDLTDRNGLLGHEGVYTPKEDNHDV